jgi:hypothetical protein
MSYGHLYLHSHSALERNVDDEDIVNKSHVLICDVGLKFFEDVKEFLPKIIINKKTYYKVPIMSFVKKGGVFKNLSE